MGVPTIEPRRSATWRVCASRRAATARSALRSHLACHSSMLPNMDPGTGFWGHMRTCWCMALESASTASRHHAQKLIGQLRHVMEKQASNPSNAVLQHGVLSVRLYPRTK